MAVARACFSPKSWRNEPLHGNMRGTRYRWISGLTLRGWFVRLPTRAIRVAPLNTDSVLIDIRRLRRLKRKRIRYESFTIPAPPGGVLQPAEYRYSEAPCEIRMTCPGCGNIIDPTTCGCGDAITHNAFQWGHEPVPMGCDCMRARAEDGFA